jgi:hypothetical protein
VTIVDILLATGFVGFVLRIEWPGERDEDDDRVRGAS